MSDIFNEIRKSEKRFNRDFNNMHSRIKWGMRAMIAWMIFCLLGSIGVIWVAWHFIAKMW